MINAFNKQILFTLLFATAFFGAVASHAKDQFEMRLNGAAALGLAEYWKATLQIESSFDEDGDKKQHDSDLGFVYTRIAEWFDVGANYREQRLNLHSSIN